MKVLVEFPGRLDRDEPANIPIGRLVVRGGIVRMHFSPQGHLILYVPESAVRAKGIVFYDTAMSDTEMLALGAG